jgi:hypothetical protein
MRISGIHKDPKKKSKPFNVKKAKKELDKLFSRYIRARDPICQRCGKTGATQCAHIFTRGNLSTRWDTSNSIGLCFYCHLYWAHREPVEFTLWITERMGDKAFLALKRKSQTIAPPFGRKEYEAELGRLELIAPKKS